MTQAERIQQKQDYLDYLAKFLAVTTGDRVTLTIDESEYVAAEITQDGIILFHFEYSVWGDNKNGMFRDTLRALIREGYMGALYE